MRRMGATPESYTSEVERKIGRRSSAALVVHRDDAETVKKRGWHEDKAMENDREQSRKREIA